MELCPESLWARLCHDDPSSTFFQTPVWNGIAASYFKAAKAPLLFRVSDVSICLPLLRKRRWGRENYFSPFGTYTALISPRKLESDELAVVRESLRRVSLHLSSSPFTLNPIKIGKILPSKTQVMDLTALDPLNPMRDWEADHRRRALLSARSGVTVRTADTKEDWDRYFELYQMSIGRWGKRATVGYPQSLFDDIRETMSDSTRMRLWLAEHNGEVGAGYLSFYHNRHAVSWHGAADNRFFKLGMTQALTLAMIRDAKQRGFAFFDLGGSSGLHSLERFKKQFGSQTLEYESSLNRTGLVGLLAGMKNPLRNLFKLIE